MFGFLNAFSHSSDSHPSDFFMDEVAKISRLKKTDDRVECITELLKKTLGTEIVFKSESRSSDPKTIIKNLPPDVLFHLCCWAGVDIQPEKNALDRAPPLINVNTRFTVSTGLSVNTRETSFYLPSTTEHSIGLRKQFYDALIDALMTHFDFKDAKQTPMRVLACLAGLAEAASKPTLNPTKKLIEFIYKLPQGLNFTVSNSTATELRNQCGTWAFTLIRKIIENVKTSNSAKEWEDVLHKLLIERDFKYPVDAKPAREPRNIYHALAWDDLDPSISKKTKDQLVRLAWMLLAAGADLKVAFEYREEEKAKCLDRLWNNSIVRKNFLLPELNLIDEAKISLITSVAPHAFDSNISSNNFVTEASKKLNDIALSILLLNRENVHFSLEYIVSKLRSADINLGEMIAAKQHIESTNLFRISNPFNLLMLLYFGNSQAEIDLSLDEIINSWPKSEISLLISMLLYFAKEKLIHLDVANENLWLQYYAEVCPQKADETTPLRYCFERSTMGSPWSFYNTKTAASVKAFSNRNPVKSTCIKSSLFSKIDCLAALKMALDSNSPCPPSKITQILDLYKSLNPGSKLIGFGSYFLPLHYAASFNLPDQLLALLSSGLFDENAVNINGNTALALALKSNNSDCVKVLKSFNAAENASDYLGICHNMVFEPDPIITPEIAENDWKDLIAEIESAADPSQVLEIELVIRTLGNPNPIYDFVPSDVAINKPSSIYNALYELRQISVNKNDKITETKLLPLLIILIKMQMAGRLPPALETFFAKKDVPRFLDENSMLPANIEKAFGILHVGLSWFKAMPSVDMLAKSLRAETLNQWLAYLYDLVEKYQLNGFEPVIKLLVHFQRNLRVRFAAFHAGLSHLKHSDQTDETNYHSSMLRAFNFRLGSYDWSKVTRFELSEGKQNFFLSLLIQDDFLDDEALLSFFARCKEWPQGSSMHVSRLVGLAVLAREMKFKDSKNLALCDSQISKVAPDIYSFIIICKAIKNLYLSEIDEVHKQENLLLWASVLRTGLLKYYPQKTLLTVLKDNARNEFNRNVLISLLQDFLKNCQVPNATVSFYLVTLVSMLDLEDGDINLPSAYFDVPGENREAFILLLAKDSFLNENDIKRLIKNSERGGDSTKLVPHMPDLRQSLAKTLRLFASDHMRGKEPVVAELNGAMEEPLFDDSDPSEEEQNAEQNKKRDVRFSGL